MVESLTGLMVNKVQVGSMVDENLKMGQLILSIAERDTVEMSSKEATLLLHRSNGMVEVITCDNDVKVIFEKSFPYKSKDL